jgi:hypothetical protein
LDLGPHLPRPPNSCKPRSARRRSRVELVRSEGRAAGRRTVPELSPVEHEPLRQRTDSRAISRIPRSDEADRALARVQLVGCGRRRVKHGSDTAAGMPFERLASIRRRRVAVTLISAMAIVGWVLNDLNPKPFRVAIFATWLMACHQGSARPQPCANRAKRPLGTPYRRAERSPLFR